MNWKQLESDFLKIVVEFAQEQTKVRSGDSVYALALTACYREREASIHLPFVALNFQEDLEGDPWDIADWGCTSDQDTELPEVARINAQLEVESAMLRESAWDKFERKFLASMAQVAKRATPILKSSIPVTSDFVCFFDDEEQWDYWVRQSVPEALFLRLWPHFDMIHEERTKLSEMSQAQRIEFLLLKIFKDSAGDGIDSDEAENMLVLEGAAIYPSLLKIVGDVKSGDNWRVSFIAAKLGLHDEKFSHWLRTITMDTNQAECDRFWAARALSAFGEEVWLEQLLSIRDQAKIAIAGLLYQYGSFYSECHNRRPFTGRALEIVYALSDPELLKFADSETGSNVDIRESDIAPVLGLLRSRNKSVQRFAIGSVWRGGSLSSKQAKQIVPILMELLDTVDPANLAFLIIVLETWKRAARPARDVIAQFSEHSDEHVRRAAKVFLENIQ